MPDKLAGVHPELREKVTRIIDAMAVLGFEMRVTDGLRSTAQQQALYALGRTEPGQIVTRADGVVRRSNHQAREGDEFGRAVDCTFWVGGAPSWANHLPWACYGEMAKALGLKWGGDFVSMKDRPHVEMR